MSDPKPQPSEPNAMQVAAMISVLGDDRGPLQRAARQRLLAWGERVVPHLREGAEAEHMSTRMRCRALLREIEVRRSLSRFGELRLDRIDSDGAPPLLDGAILLAQMVRTFVPEARTLAATLRRQAGALRRQFAGRSLPTCARLLAERLHDELGLRGGDADALDVEHVLIDRAWSNRVGAPIALSLIYLLVARWAGLSAAGVAMPDHFLVRLHGPRSLLLDPFHGGRVIPKADCARYLRRSGHVRVREHLRDLSDREVLIRYLHSLQNASSRRGGSGPLQEALDLLQAS